MKKWMTWGALGLISLVLVACGEKKSDDVADPNAPDITQEKLDYYAANPDFFSFKTPADIPADLVWENGMDQPDIGDPNAKKGGTYHERIQDFPRTLRLIGPDSNGSFRPFLLDFVRLSWGAQHPETGKIYPELAKEWAIDWENKTGYIRINPEARWSDGEPVTADDMMFAFFFYRSKYIQAPWYNNYYATFYKNITKYDDHTFSVTVPEAKPDMPLRIVGLGPKPEHFYKELGDDFVERYQWRFEPTTGPYVVRDEDIKKVSSITLRRDKNWWAKDNKFFRNRFNFDTMRFTVIRDTPKALESFKNGELDRFGVTIPEYWYDKLPNSDPDVQAGYIHKDVFYNVWPRPTYGLWINQSKPLLDNRDIRVGINYATNWELVIEKYFRGDYARMNTTADGFGEFTHPTLKSRPFDIEKALEAFARAGFTERNEEGILVNDKGDKLSFQLTTGYEVYREMLPILREEARKAGLDLRIEVLDSTGGWKKAQEKKHDIMFTAFGVGLEMYPRYWETYHSDNAYDVPYLEDGSVNPDRKVKPQTNNFQEIADPKLDALIEQYRSSDDKEEMKKLAFQMEEMLYEDASFVPGWVVPFYRTAHWRYLRYPEGVSNVKNSQYDWQWFVHWIDEDMKKETLDAMKSGKTFPVETNVYDQYKDEAE